MSVSRSSAERGSGAQGARLSARRRLRRRRIIIASGILSFVFLAGVVFGLQQDAVRISHVQIFGADQSFADIAKAAMQGKYFGIIPRDSIFFYPASNIRTSIMSAHSDIAAVAIFRNGFTGLSIRVDRRVPIARWCGLAPMSAPVPGGPSHGSDEYCYVFDAGGFIFAAAATSTQTVNSFVLYAPLAENAQEPLRATIANVEKLPAVFDFARQLPSFGSPAIQVVIRGDEVDDYLASGTRITYTLGNERNAFAALSSAHADINLTGGSVNYVDLRFDGKVYVKKVASSTQER